jgi:hypothetical protein
MAVITLDLDEKVTWLLRERGYPIEEAAREMVLLGLYTKKLISSRDAAALLKISWFDFLRRTAYIRNPRRTAVVMGGGCLGVLTITGYKLSHIAALDHRWEYLVLCSMIGGLLGWTVAMLASPAERDRKDFLTFSKLLSGFVSGFLLVKVTPLLDDYLKNPTAEVTTRVAFGFAAFLVGLMWTFLVRRYSEAPALGPPTPDRKVEPIK